MTLPQDRIAKALQQYAPSSAFLNLYQNLAFGSSEEEWSHPESGS
jgi:hypothetical protein